MLADSGVLITLLEKEGINRAKTLILAELTKRWPAIMAAPVFGPVLGYIIGLIVSKVLNVLAEDAEFLAFTVNTYIRVTAQAKAVNVAQDQIEAATTEGELDAAEKESLQAFDDIAKFNR